MTKLYVTEYAELTLVGTPNGVPAQCPKEPPLASQVVDFTAGAAQSAAFNAKTTFVRLQSDAACSVKFGADPTATTSDQRLAADQETYRGVAGDGSAAKVSAIANG